METPVLNSRILIILGTLVVLGGLYTLLRPDESAAPAQTRTIQLDIRSDVMTPDRVEVARNDVLTFNVTSDEALELHLHGYDQSVEVEPGVAAVLRVEATLSGSFEFENEEAQTALGTLTVRPR